MKTEDWVLIGVFAVGLYAAYSVYRAFNPQANNPGEVKSWLSGTGYETASEGKNTILKVKTNAGTSNYYFSVDDFNKMNPAQKILLTADKIIPGSWLTKLVLE